MPLHADLNYIEHGNHQEVLVMLHGFMGKASLFNTLAEKLSERFRIIAIDLPGHGNSRFDTSPGLNRLSSFSDTAKAVLDTLLSISGINTFYLYGYSMGGRIAQNICLLAPEKIRHLILESAAFGIQDETQRKQRYEKDMNMLSGISSVESFRQFLKKWHALPLFSTLSNTSLLEKLTQQKLENTVSELQKALCLMSTGNHPFFARELSKLNIPISYFYGDHDEKYKVTAQETLKIIPHMQIHAIKDASHNIHIQYPECIIRHMASL